MNPVNPILDALHPPNVTADDGPGIQDLLSRTQPETQRLQTEYQGACERFDGLAQVKRTRAAELVDAERALNERTLAATQEGVDSPCCDFAGIAESLQVLERTARLVRDTCDYIDYVLLPQAEERNLESLRDLRRSEHLEAALICAAAQADMLRRVYVGFGQAHGRVAVVSETVQRLQGIADEAQRQAQVAAAQLDDFRQRRMAGQQARTITGLTHAEAVHAAVELARINEDSNR